MALAPFIKPTRHTTLAAAHIRSLFRTGFSTSLGLPAPTVVVGVCQRPLQPNANTAPCKQDGGRALQGGWTRWLMMTQT
jgi:hypothetical protein